MELTFVAARVGGASGSIALSGVSAVHGSVVVGARVVRAERLAALFFLALVTVALHVVGVRDWSVTVGAADGVAVGRAVFIGIVASCALRKLRVETSEDQSRCLNHADLATSIWRAQGLIYINCSTIRPGFDTVL